MKRLLIPLLLLAAMAAHADGPLTSEMKTFLVKPGEHGHEVLKPAKKAVPGDIIEYRMIYKNTSGKPLSGLTITGPIPANTVYLGHSDHTKVASDFVVSADDGASYHAEPIKETRTDADGKKHQVVVPPSRYTQIRWRPDGPIKPGQQEIFSYRVKVK